MSHCTYYRESEMSTYIPECCVEDGFAFNDVHPMDIEGKYCQHCGGKIKYKEYTRHPLLEDSE